MPWATRGRHRYYFRRRTVKGREVRRFFGRGPEAHLAAALDACRRARMNLLIALGRVQEIEVAAAIRSVLDTLRDADTADATSAPRRPSPTGPSSPAP
jgi:hypothetical protein